MNYTKRCENWFGNVEGYGVCENPIISVVDNCEEGIAMVDDVGRLLVVLHCCVACRNRSFFLLRAKSDILYIRDK